jgi:hypothetical protein
MSGLSGLRVAFAACVWTGCALSLPEPDCVVADGPRLDCGVVEPSLLVSCRDSRLPDVDVLARTPESARSQLLCEEGAETKAEVSLACELPVERARTPTAWVTSSCGSSAEGADTRVFEVKLDAYAERACGRGVQGSLAEARPVWRGRLVGDASRVVTYRIEVFLSRRDRVEDVEADTYASCAVTVGTGAPVSLGRTGQLTRLGRLDAAGLALVVDCSGGQGLARAHCYNAQDASFASGEVTEAVVQGRAILRVTLTTMSSPAS